MQRVRSRMNIRVATKSGEAQKWSYQAIKPVTRGCDREFLVDFFESLLAMARKKYLWRPVSQSVISRSRPALTPLPARSPAPPLPV